MAVGAQGIAEDMGVAAVVLGAGDGETIAKAVELLGVDTVNGETPLQQGIDDRPMRDLDGDGNPLRHTATLFRQPRAQLGQPFPAVGERPFNDDDAVTIKKANLVPLGRPVNASKPIKVHRLSPLLPRSRRGPHRPQVSRALSPNRTAPFVMHPALRRLTQDFTDTACAARSAPCRHGSRSPPSAFPVWPGTRRLIHLLPSFALCAAFPHSGWPIPPR